MYRFKNIENESVDFSVLKQHFTDLKNEGKSKIEERIVKKYIDDGFVQLKEKDKWIDIDKDNKSKIKIVVDLVKQDLNKQNKALNEHLDKLKKELTSLIASVLDEEFKLIKEKLQLTESKKAVLKVKEKSPEPVSIAKPVSDSEDELVKPVSDYELAKKFKKVKISKSEKINPKESESESEIKLKPKKKSKGSEEKPKEKSKEVKPKEKSKEKLKEVKPKKKSKSKETEETKIKTNSLEDYLNKNSSDEENNELDPKDFVRFMDY